MNTASGPHCICPEQFTGKHCQRGKEMLGWGWGEAGEQVQHLPTEEVPGPSETLHGPSLS